MKDYLNLRMFLALTGSFLAAVSFTLGLQAVESGKTINDLSILLYTTLMVAGMLSFAMSFPEIFLWVIGIGGAITGYGLATLYLLLGSSPETGILDIPTYLPVLGVSLIIATYCYSTYIARDAPKPITNEVKAVIRYFMGAQGMLVAGLGWSLYLLSPLKLGMQTLFFSTLGICAGFFIWIIYWQPVFWRNLFTLAGGLISGFSLYLTVIAARDTSGFADIGSFIFSLHFLAGFGIFLIPFMISRTSHDNGSTD